MIGLAACGGSDGDTSTALDPEVAIDQRAAELVAKMTLDEKIQLVHGTGSLAASGAMGIENIHGIPRLGIPDYFGMDTSTGVNMYMARFLGKQGRSTGPDDLVNAPTPMPSALALAASWDPDLSYEYGALVAKEARILGYAEALGGAVNLAREPRNGRVFENMGEDPVLAGQMIVPRIKSTQDNKVVATIKHFAGNEQEANRKTSNSIIDERTLREIYLLPFEIGVKDGQPGNVMCAYNLLNGVKACENKYLLTDILKTEWKFKGKVQSDWTQAITDTVRGAMAGADEEEPGSLDDEKNNTFFNQRLKAAVQSGAVPESRLNDMVHRRLRTMIKVGIMDSPAPTTRGNVDMAAGDVVAQKVAEQSMVLLKNAAPSGAAAPVLPLNSSSINSIVVIGGHADVGVMSGGGSGAAIPRDGSAVPCTGTGNPDPMKNGCANWYKSSPLSAIKAKAPNATVGHLE